MPWVSKLAARRRDPFAVLVSTILSLRTKDEVTAEASRRLLAVAPGPRELSRMPVRRIERLIYPVGFYRTKAARIRGIARKLLEAHDGRVPATMEELLELEGVGRKTANLVLTLGYGKPGICVDTHVHRISNRIGWVATKTPERTEAALRRRIPRRYWISLNGIMVRFGQRICRPVSPFCSRCPLGARCPRIGVGKWR